MDEPIYLMTQHVTTNDRNGNPRRVYVFSELRIYPADDSRAEYYGNDGYSHIVFTHDEGYGGRRPAMEQFRKRGYAGPCIDNGRVDVSISDYKRLVKWTPDA